MDSVSLFAHASTPRNDPACLLSFFGTSQDPVLGAGAGTVLESTNGACGIYTIPIKYLLITIFQSETR